jgi:hypothetical protein
MVTPLVTVALILTQNTTGSTSGQKIPPNDFECRLDLCEQKTTSRRTSSQTARQGDTEVSRPVALALLAATAKISLAGTILQGYNAMMNF